MDSVHGQVGSSDGLEDEREGAGDRVVPTTGQEREETTGHASRGVPLVDPARRNYWDGTGWRPLPTTTQPARRRWVRWAVAAAALALVAGAGGVFMLRAGESEAEKKKAEREQAFLAKIADSDLFETPFSDEGEKALLELGYSACADYRAGMTYDEVWSKYNPPGSAPGSDLSSPDPNRTADDVAEVVVGALEQSFLIGMTTAYAAEELCPEVEVDYES